MIGAIVWFIASFPISADTITIYPNKYRLEIKNYVQSPGLKVYASDSTTQLPAGFWKRYVGIGWSQEILCDFNLSGIPENATITSVNFNYFIDSVRNPPYTVYYDHNIVIYKNTRTWSGTPQYNDLGSQAWPEADSVIMDNRLTVARGWRNFPDNQKCKTLVQGWLSNPSSNKGLVITNNAFHETYYVKISKVRMTVSYTLPPAQVSLKVVPSISYFALYARNGIYLQDQSRVLYGAVGTDSNASIELRPSAIVKGDVYSGRDVLLNGYSKTYGDVTAQGWVSKLTGAYISGFKRDTTPVPYFTIWSPDFNAIGGRTFEVMPGDSLRLTSPLNTTRITAHDNSRVIFGPGEYYMYEFICGNNVQIAFDGSVKDNFCLNIQNSFTMGNKCRMLFSNAVNPLSVRVNYIGYSPLALSYGSEIYGVFTCKNAHIEVKDSAKVYGALFGRDIAVCYAAQVTRPPVLTDFYHTEVAFGPVFDPYTLRYKAVVPPSTSSLIVTPTPEKENATVTVNGNSPAVPVNLVPTNTDIVIGVQDNESGLSTFYTLTVVKDEEYMVHVASGVPPRDSSRSSSWTNAFNNFYEAMPYAQSTGKEIWVKEGTYPSFYESDVLTLSPGIELIGGFRGDETERDPKGSVYNTIITSDRDSNDWQISSWPPSESDFSNYLSYNWPAALHIFSFGKGAHSMRIEGFTLKEGVAVTNPDRLFDPPWYISQALPRNYFQSGVYHDSSYAPIRTLGSGAGIYNSFCSPIIEKCVIKRNWAESVGGGMFSRCSPVFTNCLFQQNVVYRNNGAGLYFQYAPACTLNGCVFDNNEVIPIPGDRLKGGAIYSIQSAITGINSVFTRNSATDSGGAIYNNTGTLKIINCTFSGNNGGYGAGAVALSKKAKASIINTILWNAVSPIEMQGDSFFVSYSCVRNGFAGQGNISSDPLFVNANKPEGDDGIYGTQDDGIKVQGNSLCIDGGKDSAAPNIDIACVPRPTYSHADIGAYEYFAIQGKFIYGKYTPAGFIEMPAMPLITNATDTFDINMAIQGKMSAVLQVEVPSNRYTDGRLQGHAFVYTADVNGNQISNKVQMQFYRVSGTQYFRTKVYDAENNPTGKVVVLVTDTLLPEGTYNRVYVLHGHTGCHLAIEVPHNQ